MIDTNYNYYSTDFFKAKVYNDKEYYKCPYRISGPEGMQISLNHEELVNFRDFIDHILASE